MKKLFVAISLSLLAVTAITSASASPDVIIGTNGDDHLTGGNSPDIIKGRGGNDSIWGNKGPDRMFGGLGRDSLHGFGSGNTKDYLNGGPGRDICVGTRHDTFVSCEVIRVRKGLGSH